MSVDVALFWGRILFLVGLYVFLMLVVLQLRYDLRARSGPTERRVAGELVVVEPGDSGLETDEAFPLTAITTVGRSPDNTVRVSDGTVSSNHGRLIHQGHNWILEDLDSTNGTYVNGKRIAGRVRVNYGDILSFGGVSLKLVRE